MAELGDESVHLVVTRPPDWNPGQDEPLNSYMARLNSVWKECYRVLKPGCRMVVNIGDHYHRSAEGVPYHVTPLNAKIANNVMEATRHNLVFLGNIVWHKSSSAEPSGTAPKNDSVVQTRNPRLSSDFEYVSLFKKSGDPPTVPDELEEADEITSEDKEKLYSGHWQFPQNSQTDHYMPFPEELPRRAIRMFTVPGDTVLDPFMGLGTTIRVADELNRSSVGYETGFDTTSDKSWREIVRGYLNPTDSTRFVFEW